MENSIKMENKKEKILIVDDVSRNIQILGNILSQKEYQIAYAQNGKQALEICEVQDFDLILLDIMMPEMDGYEVCEIIKNDPRIKHIPIIFLTAKADMDSIIKGFDVGGQDYITKPFNSAELLARVSSHLLIKRQKEQLIDMNNNLEFLVKERTAELETANHKLNVLDKAKSSFLSIISHEIRTPLNGIVVLADLLSQSNIDDDQKENILFLKEVSNRLMRFSDAALLITSLKAHNKFAEISPVNLEYILSESINEFINSNQKSTLNIISSTLNNNKLIKVDFDLFKKCIVIIIANSSKFAGDNAKLVISSKEVDDMIFIEFLDNGPGFSKEALSVLFDDFSAGDLLHTEGAGLGLATCKLILEAHEGSIEITNMGTGGAKVILGLRN